MTEKAIVVRHNIASRQRYCRHTGAQLNAKLIHIFVMGSYVLLGLMNILSDSQDCPRFPVYTLGCVCVLRCSRFAATPGLGSLPALEPATPRVITLTCCQSASSRKHYLREQSARDCSFPKPNQAILLLSI